MTDIEWIKVDSRNPPEYNKDYLLMHDSSYTNIINGQLIRDGDFKFWRCCSMHYGTKTINSNMNLPFQDITHYAEFNMPDEILIK